MKFLLDMGISPETGKYLTDAGYDTVHLVDRDMHKVTDLELLDMAGTESRILLTHDLD